MAKISARGAREIARITATRPGASGRYLYVLASDGRVLTRYSGGQASSAYKVRGRIRNPDARTRESLALVVKRDGLVPEEA